MNTHTTKEQPGLKEHIKIQAHKVTKKNHYAITQFPDYLQNKLNRDSYRSQHSILVEVKDIDTRDKLAYVINKNYGVGVWLIYVWDVFKPNKKHSSTFMCKGDTCPSRKQGKCNHKFYNARQKVRGWSCPQNRKLAPNWGIRAKIEIYPADNPNPLLQYRYKWHPEYDQMHRFSRWFWKGR